MYKSGCGGSPRTRPSFPFVAIPTKRNIHPTAYGYIFREAKKEGSTPVEGRADGQNRSRTSTNSSAGGIVGSQYV
eukprot:scaffold228453_cov76-Cyclotella_meneghiniana.AAC.1